MYVEEIDLGEPTGPRTIVSAVRLHVPMNEVLDSLVVVFKNLKPTDLRGVMSNGMIFAASNQDKSKIELIRPPNGCTVGERIVLENDDMKKYTPDELMDLKPKKKKGPTPWDVVMLDLKTNEQREACYKGVRFITSKGPLTCKSLVNANIS